MGSPEDANYVCTLDQVSIKKAKDELNENPEDRLAAVQALREWIQAQPHIKMPLLDTYTLLRFLRGAKFSQIRARELVEGNLLLRQKMPVAFLEVDSHQEELLALLRTGAALPLPKRTPQGCLVFLTRLGKLDVKTLDVKMFIRVATILFDYFMRSEMSQVNGVVFLEDLTGLSVQLLTKLLNKELSKWEKMWHKNTPGRFKGFNYYNTGVVFEILFAFFKPLVPQKWIARVHTHETLESVYKTIPKECLPVEYLPDDYTGPNVGTCEQVLNNFLADIQNESYRQALLHWTSGKFGVDLSKKPEETVTQHFRKLNVD